MKRGHLSESPKVESLVCEAQFDFFLPRDPYGVLSLLSRTGIIPQKAVITVEGIIKEVLPQTAVSDVANAKEP